MYLIQPVTVQPTTNFIHSSDNFTAQPIYGQNQPARNAPPTGMWRDGICDCCTNLWPSCGCVFIWNGAWILAQSNQQNFTYDQLFTFWLTVLLPFRPFSSVSQKTGFASFRLVVIPLVIADVVCLVISVFAGAQWVYFLPGIIVYILSILVRIHFVQKFALNQSHMVVEACTAIWCCPCSIAQSKFLALSISD